MIQQSRKWDSHISCGQLGIILPSVLGQSRPCATLHLAKTKGTCSENVVVWMVYQCLTIWNIFKVIWCKTYMLYYVIIIHYLSTHRSIHISISPYIHPSAGFRIFENTVWFDTTIYLSIWFIPPANIHYLTSKKLHNFSNQKHPQKNVCSHSLITSPWLRSHWNWRLSQWHEAQCLRHNWWTKSWQIYVEMMW